MSDRKVGTRAKQLIEAKARIADRKNWCQHELVNHRGQLCAFGALYVGKNYWDNIHVAILNEAAKALFPIPNYGGMMEAAWVNDNLGHAAVMKVYDLAIQNELNRVGSDVLD